MSGKAILILFAFLLAAPSVAFAHGGGHSEEKSSADLTEEVTPLNDSIYAVDAGEESGMPDPSDTPMGSLFSSNDILGNEDPLADMEMGDGEPMKRFKEKTDAGHEQGQHEMHKQHVEEATHEWVSPHAKGYGVAVGITIISGLVFAGLSILRMGEGNSNRNLE